MRATSAHARPGIVGLAITLLLFTTAAAAEEPRHSPLWFAGIARGCSLDPRAGKALQQRLLEIEEEVSVLPTDSFQPGCTDLECLAKLLPEPARENARVLGAQIAESEPRQVRIWLVDFGQRSSIHLDFSTRETALEQALAMQAAHLLEHAAILPASRVRSACETQTAAPEVQEDGAWQETINLSVAPSGRTGFAGRIEAALSSRLALMGHRVRKLPGLLNSLDPRTSLPKDAEDQILLDVSLITTRDGAPERVHVRHSVPGATRQVAVSCSGGRCDTAELIERVVRNAALLLDEGRKPQLLALRRPPASSCRPFPVFDCDQQPAAPGATLANSAAREQAPPEVRCQRAERRIRRSQTARWRAGWALVSAGGAGMAVSGVFAALDGRRARGTCSTGFSNAPCVYDTQTGGIIGLAASAAVAVAGLAVAVWPARVSLPSTGELACDDR